jgi:hypothetical protein
VFTSNIHVDDGHFSIVVGVSEGIGIETWPGIGAQDCASELAVARTRAMTGQRPLHIEN